MHKENKHREECLTTPKINRKKLRFFFLNFFVTLFILYYFERERVENLVPEVEGAANTIKSEVNGNVPKRIPPPINMIAGLGSNSYFKQSYYQRLAANVAKLKIDEAIMAKLDVVTLATVSHTIRLADFGCAVGPNTFDAMQGLLELAKRKFLAQCPTARLPPFQVLFNDQPSNDFNTLFTSLPSEREYFAAGVPGSFHQRVLPEKSVHLAHSSYALHWLSKVPEGLVDKNSPAYNKGKIHYAGAPEEVRVAYANQFAIDLEHFLDARAREVVPGGMVVVISPSIPDEMPYSEVANGLMYLKMQSILEELVKEEFVSQELADSFNLPIYACPPGEFSAVVQRNGCFSIEVIGLTNPAPWLKGAIDMPVFVKHVRAAMEGMFNNHFPDEITDQMFTRLVPMLEEISGQMEKCYRDGLQLFAVLQRNYDQ